MIFLDTAVIGNTVGVRCNATLARASAAGWKGPNFRYLPSGRIPLPALILRHRGHRNGLCRGGGHLQLPHRKHARGNRPGGWLVGRFRLHLPRERGGPPRPIFFQIRKHETLLR
jgi:hypothetical protein